MKVIQPPASNLMGYLGFVEWSHKGPPSTEQGKCSDTWAGLSGDVVLKG